MQRGKHRGQQATEYIIVLGLLLGLLVPISYFYFFSSTSTAADAEERVAHDIGNTITTQAEEVFYSPGYAKRTLELGTPGLVEFVYVENKTTLVINYSTQKGKGTLSFRSRVPLVSTLTPDDLNMGRVVIERKGPEFILICNPTKCTCLVNESGYCNTGIDEDCDWRIDFKDTDCGTDADNDTYTLQAGDCNDTNSSIHPGGIELCDNIDQDCDGNATNGIDPDLCQAACSNITGSYWNITKSVPYACCGDDALEGFPFEMYETLKDGRDNDCDGIVDDGLCRTVSGGACDSDEVCVLRYENASGGSYNAHMQNCSFGTYNNAVCCRAVVGTMNVSYESSCSEAGVINYANLGGGTTNAHAANYSAASPFYPNSICLSVNPGTISCRTVDHTIGCNYTINEACVLQFENSSLGTTNAHVSRCSTDYAWDVCCNVTTP
jgi:hypothetical protein